MIDFIPEFAANVPKLRFLRVSASNDYVPEGYLERMPTTDWEGFRALETVVWSVRDDNAFVWGQSWRGSFGKGEAFASAISGVCATLTTFISVGTSGEDIGYRRGDDGVMYRLAGGADLHSYTGPNAWRTI